MTDEKQPEKVKLKFDYSELVRMIKIYETALKRAQAMGAIMKYAQEHEKNLRDACDPRENIAPEINKQIKKFYLTPEIIKKSRLQITKDGIEYRFEF